MDNITVLDMQKLITELMHSGNKRIDRGLSSNLINGVRSSLVITHLNSIFVRKIPFLVPSY